jgi:hypothetical protein
MAISAVRFIGLTLGAVALGVLSAGFAFGQIEPYPSQIMGDGAMGERVLGTNSQDEIPHHMYHISRR